MGEQQVTQVQVEAFLCHLAEEERSRGTREKYRRDIRAFLRWLGHQPIQRETLTAWKAHLLAAGYCPTTVNSMLTAVNLLLRYLGMEGCCVRALRVQRRVFRDPARELSREEYERLCAVARGQRRERLALVIESLCATGMRVSEVEFLTVEALRQGQVQIALKGKIRVILLPGKLRRKLLAYARSRQITAGVVFRTRNGTPLGRKQIWAEMKGLCAAAGVEPSKVFPHNLRHLFARTFYRVCRDVVKLADVLGHSSIETTRIYLRSTGSEHVQQLERLRLIL